MSTKKIIVLLLFYFVIVCAFNNSYAGDVGEKEVTSLDHKVDTKDLSGVNLWIANLYNNNRLMYAIVVTLVMAILGTTMAFGTDLVLKMFGMDVSKISHRE
jgi:flagellar biosynthesis protein FlhB